MSAQSMMMGAGLRPISRDEHEAATRRLDPANSTYRTIRFPDGSEMQWRTGTVDANDYSRRDGYAVWFEGFDRFGWPVGHPDSPATGRETP